MFKYSYKNGRLTLTNVDYQSKL